MSDPIPETPAEGFRDFEHTADVGLEVWAATPARLYALAAEAVARMEVEAPRSTPDIQVTLDLDGDDPADLLVHWLNTSLLEAELRGAVWIDAEVHLRSPLALHGVLRGVARDRMRQVFLREIKAVSQHALELDLTPGGCRCRLILDL